MPGAMRGVCPQSRSRLLPDGENRLLVEVAVDNPGLALAGGVKAEGASARIIASCFDRIVETGHGGVVRGPAGNRTMAFEIDADIRAGIDRDEGAGADRAGTRIAEVVNHGGGLEILERIDPDASAPLHDQVFHLVAVAEGMVANGRHFRRHEG